MDPEKIHAGTVLGNEKRFAIPPYQRSYSWDKKNWQTLWDDMIEAYSNGRKHFLGTLVVVEKNREFEVVDGQQRLTTIYLLTAAIAASYRANGSGESSMRLLHERIIYPYREEGDPHRLALSNRSPANDHDNLKACIDGIKHPEREARAMTGSIGKAYRFFMARVKELRDSKKSDPEGFVENALIGLQLLMIKLDEKDDDPQRVYRSINATGKKLTGADMIRNHVLMGLPHDMQEKLYVDHWQILDGIFSEKLANSFDKFMRYYIAIKRTERDSRPHGKDLLCKEDAVEIFETFCEEIHKDIHESDSGDKFRATNDLLADLKQYARCYQRVIDNEAYCTQHAGGKSTSLDIDIRCHTPFRQNGFFPFLMELLNATAQRKCNESDARTVLRVIEGYSIRRSVAKSKLPSLVYNNIGPELWQATLQHERNGRGLVDAVALGLFEYTTQRPTSRYPQDAEILDDLISHRYFGQERIAKDVLVNMERHFSERGYESGQANKVEMEHIMPQKLSRPGWDHITSEEHEDNKNHFGNLTLQSKNNNIANSNHPFAKKKSIYAGSSFKLNIKTHLGDKDNWDIAAIEERAAVLADIFIETWPIPDVLKHSGIQSIAKEANLPRYQRILDENPAIAEQFQNIIAAIEEMPSDIQFFKTIIRCDAVNAANDELSLNFAYFCPDPTVLRLELKGDTEDYADVCAKHDLTPDDITDKGAHSYDCNVRIRIPWGENCVSIATDVLEVAYLHVLSN